MLVPKLNRKGFFFFFIHVPTTVSPFELVHMDIWSPYSQSDITKHHYFLTVIDDFIKCTWTFLWESLLIPQFYQLVQNQFNYTIKRVRIDNGPEFMLDTFFASKGIIRQISCVYTPNNMG